jgi:hypothetical protein
MYPLGGVEVLVSATDLERAREILGFDDVAEALGGGGCVSGPVEDRAGDRRADAVFGAVLVALVVGFLLARLLALS